MKVLPFLVSSARAVKWQAPLLRCHGEVITPGQAFTSWDYLSEVAVDFVFHVDHEILAAGVLGASPSPDAVTDVIRRTDVVLQVECASTQYRQLAMCRLTPGSMADSLSLLIPAGMVANDLILTASVVLREKAAWGDLSPRQAGSRMIGEDERWTVRLEGKGTSFPVSAFDFTGTGFPEGALWYVKMEPERLTDPFGAVVRLLINSGHPRSGQLLQPSDDGSAKDLSAMLEYDLLATMLETTAAIHVDDLSQDFEEGSLGMVLAQLSSVYFGESLPDLAAQIGRDRPAFRGLLQKQIEFLAHGGEER